jgi:AbrB family looped-hinge helix DNA binding protein
LVRSTQRSASVAKSLPEQTTAKTAKITSKGQITIPSEVRRELDAKPGDKLSFQRTEHGISVTRHLEESRFEKRRGIGNGLPDEFQSPEGILRYMREMRGWDEIDEEICGPAR